MTRALGIFGLLPYGDGITLFAHAVPLTLAEAYGDRLSDPHSHYEAWENTKPGGSVLAPLIKSARAIFARSKHEDWPRGRVVHDSTSQKFIVYADRQIFSHAPLVRAHFSLSRYLPFRTDLHDRNSKRLRREQLPA